MSTRVGICPVCKLKQRTVRAWHSTEHEPEGAIVVRRHPELGSDGLRGCAGTGRAPLPTPEQLRRERARGRQLADLLAPFRPQAAVALDACLEQRTYPADEIEILCRVACFHYVLMWPRERAPLPVRFVPRLNRHRVRMNAGDVYCLFCGVLVVRNVGARGDRYERSFSVRWLARTNGHVIECALKHLAFGLAPVAPNVRRLPDEYLPAETSP